MPEESLLREVLAIAKERRKEEIEQLEEFVKNNSLCFDFSANLNLEEKRALSQTIDYAVREVLKLDGMTEQSIRSCLENIVKNKMRKSLLYTEESAKIGGYARFLLSKLDKGKWEFGDTLFAIFLDKIGRFQDNPFKKIERDFGRIHACFLELQDRLKEVIDYISNEFKEGSFQQSIQFGLGKSSVVLGVIDCFKEEVSPDRERKTKIGEVKFITSGKNFTRNIKYAYAQLLLYSSAYMFTAFRTVTGKIFLNRILVFPNAKNPILVFRKEEAAQSYHDFYFHVFSLFVKQKLLGEGKR